MSDFHTQDVHSWSEFASIVLEHRDNWVYRGQRQDWQLKSSLERAIDDWQIERGATPAIETQLIREFRRNYRGDDLTRAEVDTLYCLALMQHHGAPTRLLDWSYSPFVAAKFAIEAGGQNAVVWCMSPSWCHSAVTTIVGEPQTAARNTDLSRNDISFRPMYGVGSTLRRKFAYVENPLQLNPRLSVQQGVFLCPGDIGAPFVDNLSAMVGFDAREHVLKLRFKLDATETHDFACVLRRMNLSSAALFPGLDGFARSLAENLFLYKRLGEDRTGDSDHSRPA